MDEVRERLAAARETSAAEPEPSPLIRRAGVLIPLFVRDGGLWILFTRRTDTVEHHRGQISFPGGSEEEEDGSLLETALRETREEIGVEEADVRYLGALTPLTTVTDFYVEPFVGAIPSPYPFRVAESEIAELIEAPVAALLDPRILEKRILPGREEPTLFYHHGAHVIWGATARMLAELLDALKG
ncbi:MAG TPA: CoA pyrophosphatase [Thermoanaerobaculia bacterium]|jgi:8-oxo-dGTP pyrophosphatase MutT (NUDIX family)